MAVDFEILLSGLPLLVAFLCWNAWRRNPEKWCRERDDWKSDREFRKHWQPAALDVSSIAPQIQQLRREHFRTVHHRSRHARYHNQLIGTVRATILRQPYFHHANDEAVDNFQGERQPAATRPS